MAGQKRMMRLGLFFMTTGQHVAAWRHPDGVPDAIVNFRHCAEVAQTAERAGFDLMFLEDGVAVREMDMEIGSRTSRAAHFEPITLLSALAAVTSRIGLVATASSTYWEPYNVARLYASLDHISGGRAGWNLVTSSTDAEALNFGRKAQDAHENRYARANEFVDIVKGLWEGWAPDAFLYDKQAGRFFDPEKVRLLNHRGQFYSVRGPLNVPRSPQGRPVLVQAGSSEEGRELAARTAEVVFTAQQTHEQARAFYADVKGRLARHGRGPDEMKILPGVMPVVGSSAAEAEDKFDRLQQLVPIEIGLSVMAKSLGFKDIVKYPLDGPLPDFIPETVGNRSRQQLLIAEARRENLTIRQLALKASASRGHWQVFGTARQIVDQLEERFSTFGCDGFNVLLPLYPNDLVEFTELVIPELRRRGLFRTSYEGTTLRANLGLDPALQW